MRCTALLQSLAFGMLRFHRLFKRYPEDGLCYILHQFRGQMYSQLRHYGAGMDRIAFDSTFSQRNRVQNLRSLGLTISTKGLVGVFATEVNVVPVDRAVQVPRGRHIDYAASVWCQFGDK